MKQLREMYYLEDREKITLTTGKRMKFIEEVAFELRLQTMSRILNKQGEGGFFYW